MSLFSPMKKIDSFIFKQCDEFKKTSLHQKIADQNSAIAEESKPIVNLLLSLTFFTLLLGFLFYFFKTNKDVRSQIQTKGEIQRIAKKYIALETKLNQSLRNILSNSNLSTAQGVSAMVQASLGATPKDKISVTDIDTTEISSTLKRATATIEFNGLHNKQLGIFINNLTNRNKVQFTSSNITRDEKTKLLSGNITILAFSK